MGDFHSHMNRISLNHLKNATTILQNYNNPESIYNCVEGVERQSNAKPLITTSTFINTLSASESQTFA